MSKIEIKTFEEEMRIAAISGELERAEERGFEKGRKEGLEKGRKEGREEVLKIKKQIILKLLEKNTPEEISKEFNIPLEHILEIKNNNSK